MSCGDRSALSARIGIPDEWATLRQVHGADIIEVTRPGREGDGDALATACPELPLSVFTADCAGVVLETRRAVAVVHAGWRGAAAGVVAETARYLESRFGDRVSRAALGPLIGSCCFEVGDEVAVRFPGRESTTRWGTVSVDLATEIRSQAPGASWWSVDACTRCGDGWFSHRATGTTRRMAAIGWIP